MDIFYTVKDILDPRDVCTRYLGTPSYKSSGTLFYYSPFRARERTASLAVTNKYITDFGTNEKYDIISFTSRLFNITTLEAVKVLAKEFNIMIDNDYTSKQVEILRQRVEEKRIIENTINNWYEKTYIRFCELYQYWNNLCEYTKFKVVGIDNLKMMYFNRDYFEYLVDTFAEATEQDKVIFYKQKERFNKYENEGYIQCCSN